MKRRATAGAATSLPTTSRLAQYWQSTFDWRAQEAKLNAYPQFTTAIRRTDRALLARQFARTRRHPAQSHSRLAGIGGRFLDVIGPLSDPRAHVGNPTDAFLR